MLLVDDYESEVVKLHSLLNEGVRTNQYVNLARSEGSQYFVSLLGTCRSGENADFQTEVFGHTDNGSIVLACQNLSRSHHTGLEAVVHGQKHRYQCHDGLSATHVALQQTIHLHSGDGVLAYLLDDTLLCPRQREWQTCVVEGVEEVAHLAEYEAIS